MEQKCCPLSGKSSLKCSSFPFIRLQVTVSSGASRQKQRDPRLQQEKVEGQEVGSLGDRGCCSQCGNGRPGAQARYVENAAEPCHAAALVRAEPFVGKDRDAGCPWLRMCMEEFKCSHKLPLTCGSKCLEYMGRKQAGTKRPGWSLPLKKKKKRRCRPTLARKITLSFKKLRL